jgi:hypothetical protein
VPAGACAAPLSSAAVSVRYAQYALCVFCASVVAQKGRGVMDVDIWSFVVARRRERPLRAFLPRQASRWKDLTQRVWRGGVLGGRRPKEALATFECEDQLEMVEDAGDACERQSGGQWKQRWPIPVDQPRSTARWGRLGVQRPAPPGGGVRPVEQPLGALRGHGGVER